MTNYTLERQLDLLIDLIQRLPERICDEFEEREDMKKSLRLREIREEMKFLHENNEEINKRMY